MTEANVKISRGSTVAGAAVWLLLLFIPFGDSDETELIQRILLLGVLVIVIVKVQGAHAAEDAGV